MRALAQHLPAWCAEVAVCDLLCLSGQGQERHYSHASRCSRHCRRMQSHNHGPLLQCVTTPRFATGPCGSYVGQHDLLLGCYAVRDGSLGALMSFDGCLCQRRICTQIRTESLHLTHACTPPARA